MHTAIIAQVKNAALAALKRLYPEQDLQEVTINETKPEFEGDYTIVLFPLLKPLGTKPQLLGDALGTAMVEGDLFDSYSVVSGFLNLSIADGALDQYLRQHYNNIAVAPAAQRLNVMVEYSSPNTNKPLHFGHLRNNFLGASISKILQAIGHNVVQANLVNDRGIHICKSMLAWQLFGNGATPETTGIKGDHLVGEYYVRFNTEYVAEVSELIAAGMPEEEAKRQAPMMLAAQEMLRRWEAGDAAVVSLWQKMNGWVYRGFDETYAISGIKFDRYYYESDTYLLGRDLVLAALERGLLFQKEDKSIWIDLGDEGLDQKLLLRGDGTSVYMTQDIGTAVLKQKDYALNRSLYVIGDEQNYHMKVLQLILQKMGEPAADGIHHVSYGMVELPEGKMKSREGTVVDADDMLTEMVRLAQEQTEAAGKTHGESEAVLADLYRVLGIGALKFYLLRVEPKRLMIFDPKESIDLHGFTATFIQYAYARIQSILRRVGTPVHWPAELPSLAPLERKLILQLEQYNNTVHKAAEELNPSELANYAFKLAQSFNSFYDQHSIAKADSESLQHLRLAIATATAHTIRHAMGLLGIEVPDKM